VVNAVLCNCKRYSVYNSCTFSEQRFFIHKSSFCFAHTFSVWIHLI